MRIVVLILSLIICGGFVVAQQDKISFNYDKAKYSEIAQKRFKDLCAKEKNKNIPVFSTVPLIDRFKIEELDFISIPIFSWKKKPYKCGDNLEFLLELKQDLLFQEVLIVKKEGNIRVGKFDIFDSYNEENRRKDSINNLEFSLHGRPVQSDTKKVDKNLHKYIKENPEVFVFMIKGLHGYWAVIDGEIVKLISGMCGIKGKNGSYFICENYGQAFINDIINDSFRTGYEYIGCSGCEINEKVEIEIK